MSWRRSSERRSSSSRSEKRADLKKILAWIDRGVEYGVAAIFAAMCVVGLLQVFNRFVLNRSLSWSEEFQIFAHIWIVFLAIPIAYRRGAHLSMDSLRAKLPRRAGLVFDYLIEVLSIWFAASLLWFGYRVALGAKPQESPGPDVPMSYPY